MTQTHNATLLTAHVTNERDANQLIPCSRADIARSATRPQHYREGMRERQLVQDLGTTTSRLEAMRCLKRRISDAIYRQLLADAELAAGTGPGGHCGATLQSSAVDLHPHIDTSDQPLPGPATATLQPSTTTRKSPTRTAHQTTG